MTLDLRKAGLHLGISPTSRRLHVGETCGQPVRTAARPGKFLRFVFQDPSGWSEMFDGLVRPPTSWMSRVCRMALLQSVFGSEQYLS